MELLGVTNLSGTVSKLPSFVPQIGLKFYVNLLKDMGKPSSPTFQKAIVRGHRFELSPSIINQYLEYEHVPDNEVVVSEIDPMVSVINGGKVQTWKQK